MDPILIVNAGSSSVKFEVVAVGGSADLKFQIRGGRWTASVHSRGCAPAAPMERSLLSGASIRATFRCALHVAGAWLREQFDIDRIAVGHGVVDGGPKYDRPVVVDASAAAGSPPRPGARLALSLR